MSGNSENKVAEHMEEFFPAERQNRLDLMLHLIPNTRQTILLRGPEQTGKSFFIRQFKKQIDESWQFLLVSANDLIQTNTPLQVLADAFDELEGNNKQLLVRLEAASKARKKIIICVEDAHQLDVARFDFLFQLLDSYDCLHMILTSSDNLGEAVESRCQLIDIEPFTQKQTTEYARKRVNKNSLNLSSLAGLDDVVLFIETGGLPGRINDVLEQMGDLTINNGRPEQAKSLPVIWLVGIAVLVMVVLIFSLYPKADNERIAPTVLQDELPIERKIEATVKLPHQLDVVEQQVIKQVESPMEDIRITKDSAQVTLLPENVQTKVVVDEKDKVNSQNVGAKKVQIEEVIPAELPVSQVAESSTEVVTEVKKAKELIAIPSSHLWLQSRDKNHFTLQLLGVSTEESARKFLRKHKAVNDLFYFQNKRNDGQWFTVVYGDFENKQKAIEETKKMPPSLFKLKPWVRKFEAIQGDIFVRK